MRGEGNWRGEHGKMEAGGGGEDLGKGRSLLVKDFCTFLNIWNCSTFLKPLTYCTRAFNIVSHCCIAMTTKQSGQS